MPRKSRDQQPAETGPAPPRSRTAENGQLSGIGRRRAAAKDEGGGAYQERREEIKQAAGELFKRHGFRGTSMGQVAEALKLDRATLYYVGSKEELFARHWIAGPLAYLGVGVSGFPNMFIVAGPGSPSLLGNVVVSIEHHADFITDLLVDARDDGSTLIEPTAAAEQWWVQHVNEAAAGTLYLAADSAGGALATAVTMVLRGTGYAPAGQVLLYPTLAPVLERRSPSIDAYGQLPSLTRGSIDWFWSHYLRAGQEREPLAVPLRQADLAGLPPATVIVAGCDLLRDEGLDYASRLEAAGVPTTAHVIAGAIHGFWWMDGVLSQAGELTALLAADLARRVWPGRVAFSPRLDQPPQVST